MATKKTSKSAKKSAKKSSAKSAKKTAATKKSSKASASKAPAKKATTVKTSQGKCTGWKAVSNRMPPGATFYVTGKCTFPRRGYKVRLVKAVPQGINPAILLLRKIVTPPSGPSATIPQTIPVRYEQKGGTNYTHVTILPDGPTIKVQIVV